MTPTDRNRLQARIHILVRHSWRQLTNRTTHTDKCMVCSKVESTYATRANTHHVNNNKMIILIICDAYIGQKAPINRGKRVKHRKHEHAHECIEPQFFWQFNVYEKLLSWDLLSVDCIILCQMACCHRLEQEQVKREFWQWWAFSQISIISFDRIREWVRDWSSWILYCSPPYKWIPFQNGLRKCESAFSASRKWIVNTLGL